MTDNKVFEIMSIDKFEKHVDEEGVSTYAVIFDGTGLLPMIRGVFQSSIFSYEDGGTEHNPDEAVIITNVSIVISRNGKVALDIHDVAVNRSFSPGLLPFEYWTAENLPFAITFTQLPIVFGQDDEADEQD